MRNSTPHTSPLSSTAATNKATPSPAHCTKTPWPRSTATPSSAQPGTVWHHPHSFDLDYGHAPTSNPTDKSRWLYLLLHCQRDAYITLLQSLPGVQEYDYSTASDNYKSRGISDTEWDQRRSDWQWLIDAPRINTVMDRFTYRPDPTPRMGYITNPDVVLDSLPTLRKRASTIALDALVAEGNPPTGDPYALMRYVIGFIGGTAHTERTTQVANTLRTISAADLTPADLA